MNMIEKLISGYPQVDVCPQDFIDHLSIGADGWVAAWISIGLAIVFGMLVYIIPIYLTEKDKVGPYPLWMHTFYCAADFMGIWVFLDAWLKFDHFPIFLLLSIGEAIWVGMEIFCLQRAVTYEKDINFKPGAPMREMLRNVDGVIDTLGERELPKEFGILKRGGHLVSLRGLPNGEFASRMHMPLWKRMLFKVAGMKYDRLAAKNKQHYHFIFVHEDGKGLQQVSRLFEEKRIPASIDEIFSLDDVNKALKKIASGGSKGKTILKINS